MKLKKRLRSIDATLDRLETLVNYILSDLEPPDGEAERLTFTDKLADANEAAREAALDEVERIAEEAADRGASPTQYDVDSYQMIRSAALELKGVAGITGRSYDEVLKDIRPMLDEDLENF